MTKLKRLYIDIDSILDTRLGLLTTINSDMAIDILDNSDYLNRDMDIFESKKYGKLSIDNYQLIKDNLSNEILRNSIITNIPKFLLTLIYTIKDNNVNTPNKSDYVLDVNIYPYELSDDEKETMSDMLNDEINSSFKINLISLSDEKINIDYCVSNYIAMIKYEYVDWLNLNTDKLKKKPIKTLSLYVPRILNGIKNFDKSKEILLSQGMNLTQDEFILKYKEYVKKLEDNNVDIYEHTSLTISNLIPIDFLDISLFCINLDILRKSTV